jgi:hypothetical protein
MKGGALEPVPEAAAPGGAPAAGGGGAPEPAADARLAPQFGQKVAASAASL